MELASANLACPVECGAYSSGAKPILDSIFLKPIFFSLEVTFKKNMA
jgi:hypothetical protein